MDSRGRYKTQDSSLEPTPKKSRFVSRAIYSLTALKVSCLARHWRPWFSETMVPAVKSVTHPFSIAVVMMQRNEFDLLPTWLAHYEHLFGSQNLWILDDASTNLQVGEILQAAERRGVRVLRFNERQGVDAKGRSVQELWARELRGFRFVIPCDADELLYLDVDGSPTTDQGEISNYLHKLPPCGDGVYRISRQIRNVPRSVSGRTASIRKGFLGRSSNAKIDVGFHFRVPEIRMVETDLGFIHFTNRPYEERIQFSRQKLEGRITSFAPLELSRKAEGGSGNHLPDIFLFPKPNTTSNNRRETLT